MLMRIPPALLASIVLATLLATGSAAVVDAGAKRAKKGEKRNVEMRFKRLDTDQNGIVSMPEFKAARLGRKAEKRAEKIFQQKDKNGDGLTLEELKTPGAKVKRKKKVA
jgi:Ca2+-binding EF-hand superfamily protein